MYFYILIQISHYIDNSTFNENMIFFTLFAPSLKFELNMYFVMKIDKWQLQLEEGCQIKLMAADDKNKTDNN